MLRLRPRQPINKITNEPLLADMTAIHGRIEPDFNAVSAKHMADMDVLADQLAVDRTDIENPRRRSVFAEGGVFLGRVPQDIERLPRQAHEAGPDRHVGRRDDGMCRVPVETVKTAPRLDVVVFLLVGLFPDWTTYTIDRISKKPGDPLRFPVLIGTDDDQVVKPVIAGLSHKIVASVLHNRIAWRENPAKVNVALHAVLDRQSEAVDVTHVQ